MARTPRERPNEGAAGDWPLVTRPEYTHEVARLFVLNVRDAMGDSSVRSVAAKADIDHNTLGRVLAGETWADMIVIAKLEKALKTKLWPGLLE